MTLAVSVHPFDVQTYPYVPGSVNPVISVVGDVGLTMTVTAGLFDNADQVPLPVAFIFAVEN